ncbi:MAG: hypothetical protein H8D78_19165 [Chloroflexi bacterium]|nr:hypothetical protein [Chloroflexota bacterium]
MKIRVLGYDPEADELDLLINVESPVAAEAVPVDLGVYIRRERTTGQVVGAFIRGYSAFLQEIRAGRSLPTEQAAAAGLLDELQAIIAWQREVDTLSQGLLQRLGSLARQLEFLGTLLVPQLAQHPSVTPAPDLAVRERGVEYRITKQGESKMSAGATMIEKRVTLSPESAARLSAVARAQRVSEEEVIRRLISIFLACAGIQAEEVSRREWQALGMAAFERAWDNEEDAIYDNWRELYGVSEG